MRTIKKIGVQRRVLIRRSIVHKREHVLMPGEANTLKEYANQCAPLIIGVITGMLLKLVREGVLVFLNAIRGKNNCRIFGVKSFGSGA